MQFKAITPFSPFIPIKSIPSYPTQFTPHYFLSSHFPTKPSKTPLNLLTFNHPILQFSQKLRCITSGQELFSETHVPESEIRDVEDEINTSVSPEKIELVEPTDAKSTSQSIWDQMIEIVKFSGPATGLWICGPLMSLIDTAVIGQGSSIELAALGPGTDEKQVQHQISVLLGVGLACGVFMFGFTKLFGAWSLTAFAGAKNVQLVPAANSYVQIRALAWPAILVGWVAQSASLGMKDSLGPLKALVVASVINGIGDIVLCIFLGYGIVGAAWATAISQIVAAYTMIDALNKKGYNGYSIAIPSLTELQEILAIAAPVAFYSMIIYFATSMGTHTVAAHQVLSQIFHMCAVWGEPLSQTAQSFMPELLYGVNRSLVKAQDLLKSLLIIGASVGLILGTIATSIPFLAPKFFTPDPMVIAAMHKVWVPFFLSLCVTPCIHSCEGTLLAGRDFKYISSSMSGCFVFGAVVLLIVKSQGLGLVGCWGALVGFQWARFFLALQRLLSPNGVLLSEDLRRFRLAELKAA
ncbi:Protein DETOXIFICATION 46 chloroplastic [Bienertia sinuspersici]